MAFEYDTGDVAIVILGGTNPTTKKKNPTDLTGYFLRKGEIKTKFGTKPLYVFRTPSGDKGIIGSGNLNKLMETKVLGLLTHVVDTGETKDIGKGNPMRVFKVGQDSSDTLDSLPTENTSDNFNSSDESDEENEPVSRPQASAIPSEAKRAHLSNLMNRK